MRRRSEVRGMPEDEPTIVLPFAVIEREGGAGEEFPLEMTLATVLADVEKQREKAGLIRKREESLEFAALLYWPIVCCPWRENRNLVFDGMSVWSYVFPQGHIPDARSFTHAADAAWNYQAVQTLLNERAAFFDQFSGTENHPIMGLFIHEEFMRDVLAHLALARPRQIRGSPMLQPRLAPLHAAEAVKRLHAIVASMVKDIDAIGAAGAALESAMTRVRTELGALREETARSYGGKIERIQPEVGAEVSRLEREREAKWSAMAPKLIDLQSTAAKAEADLANWESESRRRDDLAAAAHAKERRDATRAGFDRARQDVQRYQTDMAQSRSSFDQQIQTQWERIRALERERDGEVSRLHQEEQSLVATAGKASNGIRTMLKTLADGVQFLESQGVPANVSDTTLIHMPIFVAAFGGERGRRMVVFPPMVARTGKGVMGSLKSTFGGAVLPLEPKTEQFEQIFRAGIEKALAEDASLSALIVSVGNANNLLHLGNLKSMLTRGLAEMKAQGWIKDKHERELLSNLERHIAAATRTAPKQVP